MFPVDFVEPSAVAPLSGELGSSVPALALLKRSNSRLDETDLHSRHPVVVVSASLAVVRVEQQELELGSVRLVVMRQAVLHLPFSSVLELGYPNGLAVQMMQENSVLAPVLVELVAPQSMGPRRQLR